MKLPTKRAFTLVELLVVISIIGMLVSLLLPAVQSARESARANGCRSNLRNIALATRAFNDSKKVLPGFINEVGTLDSAIKLRASWVVMLLPYLEERSTWEEWSLNNRPNSHRISLLICPSDPSYETSSPSLSYVVNTGQHYVTKDMGEENYIRGPNGLFFDKSHLGPPEDHTNPPSYLPKLNISMTNVETNDGTTKTLMLSESIQATYWVYDPTDHSPNSTLIDRQYYFGFFWRNDTSPIEIPPERVMRKDVYRINGNRTVASPTTIREMGYHLGYPSSNHPGMVNVAFCDGRVAELHEEVDEAVYRQLMTHKSKESDDYTQTKTTPLDESKY